MKGFWGLLVITTIALIQKIGDPFYQKQKMKMSEAHYVTRIIEYRPIIIGVQMLLQGIFYFVYLVAFIYAKAYHLNILWMVSLAQSFCVIVDATDIAVTYSHVGKGKLFPIISNKIYWSCNFLLDVVLLLALIMPLKT